MPEVEIITGKVEAISPKKDEDYYGLKINNSWFNGKPDVPSDVEKGCTVEFEFLPGEFIDLKNIKVVEEKESKPKDSKAQTKEKKGAEPSGEGSGSTTDSKPNKYDIGMCFKDALDKASPHQDKEEYIEQVVKFTNWNLEARQRVKEE